MRWKYWFGLKQIESLYGCGRFKSGDVLQNKTKLRFSLAKEGRRKRDVIRQQQALE